MGLRTLVGDERLGFGGAPLGNMSRDVSDGEADATLDAAWQAGTRYFDTAPFYGVGLSEERVGRYLARHDRDRYLLSTKVGRRVVPGSGHTQHIGAHAGAMVYDYTHDGTLRSVDESAERLGVDRIDFVWVHDVAQDFHGDEWLARFETARNGAFRALTRLRDQRVICGWGLSVNRTEPIELALQLSESRPDSSLLAGRYTLLDHEHALQRLMPAAQEQGIDIVVGSPFSSGVLSGGTYFDYKKTPPATAAKMAGIRAVADRHGVAIKSAALQFCLAHPATAAVIPGASRPQRIAEYRDALDADIPADFWHEMRARELVSAAAPLPVDRPSTPEQPARSTTCHDLDT